MESKVLKFMVDHNVGKLAKWLRMVGYDTRFFTGENDSDMVAAALNEHRIILTRDTQIARRRLACRGQLKVILIRSDRLPAQIQQTLDEVPLNKNDFRPFSLCLEDNQPLLKHGKEELKDRIPPYVYQTQNEFVECPLCHRIYWKGTHWQNMMTKISNFKNQ